MTIDTGQLGGEMITLEDIRRNDFEERLAAWRTCGTPVYEMAAREIDTLRALVDEQLQAMNNTPAGDMNHAGRRWYERATKVRQPKGSNTVTMPTDTRDIRRMIATATIGDGDQVLNILEKVCDKIDEITRHDAGNCEICAARYEAEQLGAMPVAGHPTKE